MSGILWGDSGEEGQSRGLGLTRACGMLRGRCAGSAPAPGVLRLPSPFSCARETQLAEVRGGSRQVGTEGVVGSPRE